MKKIVLLVALVAFAFPAAAQKNPLKWLRSLYKPRPAAPSFRVVQGKKLPYVGLPVVSSRQLLLEKYVARAVVPTKLEAVQFATTPVSPAQKELFLDRYRETLEHFKAFKQDSAPFLYYRLRDPGRDDISPEENQRLFLSVMEMERELLRLAAVVDAKKDGALSFALEYVARVRDELAPILKGLTGADIYFTRDDRSFVGDEFYLHASEFKRWTDMLRRGQAIEQAKKLPRGLRVAVLNDRSSVLDNMWHSHQKGIFVRGGELACFSRADDLIAAVRAGRTYDIILTDIIVPGGGGYYLTNILRLDGYQGSIIALSAYERDDSMGLDMFDRGFDGMLNLPVAFEHSPFWEADVLRGLNKYFELRTANQWHR